jgi:hypothetical protein
VNVFEFGREDELAPFDTAGDVVESGDDELSLIVGDQTDFRQHASVSLAGDDILLKESAVETDRLRERFDAIIGGFGESTAPGFLTHDGHVLEQKSREWHTERLPFLVNELDVMHDVIGRSGENLLKSSRTAFVVSADPLQNGIGQSPQDASQLSPSGLDDGQLFFEIAIVVGECGDEEILIGTDERRIVESDDAFGTVGQNGIEVGNVSDHFKGRPFSGDRPG